MNGCSERFPSGTYQRWARRKGPDGTCERKRKVRSTRVKEAGRGSGFLVPREREPGPALGHLWDEAAGGTRRDTELTCPIRRDFSLARIR